MKPYLFLSISSSVMNRKEFDFQVKNLALSGQYYPVEKAVAVVVLVHGMGEYSRRYERTVIPRLQEASIALFSYDQFGHGGSAEKKGDNPGYPYVLDALGFVISKARTIYPELPVFLYGHSMGGNVVINYALRRKDDLKGVIATSPFLKLAFEPPAWKLFFGKLIATIYPSLTMPNELDLDFISKDENEIEAYKNDPLIHDRISPRYSIDFMKTGEWALNHAGDLNIPLLLFHGLKDKITSPDASRHFAKEAGEKVTFITFPDGYHELHHDQEKEALFDHIVDWIKKRITIT